MLKKIAKENLHINTVKEAYHNLGAIFPLGYFTLNQKGIILEVNDAGAELIGINKLDLLNNSLLRYVCPNSHKIFYECCQNVLNTMESKECEIQLLQRYGRILGMEVSIRFLITAMGEKNLIVILKKAINSSRLEQDLSSIVSFQLKIPLTILNKLINTCIENLLENIYSTSVSINLLKEGLAEVARISQIISRMGNLISKKTIFYEKVCIKEFMANVFALIKKEIKGYPVNISYIIDEDDFSHCTFDKFHLEQAILNIIRHSIENIRYNKIKALNLIIQLSHQERLKISIKSDALTIDNSINDFNLLIASLIIQAHNGLFKIERRGDETHYIILLNLQKISGPISSK